MLVYRGRGWWVLVVPLAILLASGFLWQGACIALGRNADELPDWYVGPPLWLAGGILYWWGRTLNKPLELAEGRTLEAGEPLDKRMRGRHSLYEISMEYWGIACFGFGILMFLIGLNK
jgi:hypothetical protein